MGGGCKLGGFKVYRIRPIRGRDLHTRDNGWGGEGLGSFFLKVFWEIIGGSRRASAMVRTDPGQSVGGERAGLFSLELLE